MRGNQLKDNSVVFSTNQLTSAKLISKLYKTNKKVPFPLQMSLRQKQHSVKIQIGNRFFTVLFEGPVCHHIKMAPEKPTQIGHEDKGSLLVRILFLKNTILTLILKFLTQASVNSFGPWREKWLTY